MKNSQETLYLEHFLDMLSAEKSVSSNTLISYRSDILDYFNYLAKNKLAFAEDSLAIFEQYLESLKNANISSRTISRRISASRQFFQFLVSEEIFSKNVLLKLQMPKTDKSLPKSLSREEIKALLEQAEQDTTPAGIRLIAMLHLLYATGMRISELINLKLHNLNNNMKNGEICRHIIVKGKGNKERMVLISQIAGEKLHEYLKIRTKFSNGRQCDWIFPSVSKQRAVTHLTRQRFGQLLTQLAIDAGLDPAKVSPHVLRHSFASHMLQNGAGLRFVQELLGHSDINSTQIYTKVINSKAQDLVLKKHPLANKKSSDIE